VTKCLRKLSRKSRKDDSLKCLRPENGSLIDQYLDHTVVLVEFMYNKEIALNSTKIVKVKKYLRKLTKKSRKDDDSLKCKSKKASLVDRDLDLDRTVVCRDLKNITNCTSHLLDKHCIHDVVITELKNDFVKALEAPCEQDYT